MNDIISPEQKYYTKGIKTLLGDPKKAILKLAWPMILAMALNSIYNIVDRIWVAGLGTSALKAIGLYFPIMMLAVAFAVGLGIGGGSTISRRIGARNRISASNAAIQTLVICFILAIFFSLPFILGATELFSLLGADSKATSFQTKSVLELSVEYGQIMFAGTIFLFFTNVGVSILRSEGNAKQAMLAITVGVVLNIALDPVFIYFLNLGIAGAAWATVLSQAISSFLICYLLFIKKTLIYFLS